MIPPRWHADGCWVCGECGSRRAHWIREDGPAHHNRDCAYSLAMFADRQLADAPRVTPTETASVRADRVMAEAIADDERETWARRVGMELDVL